MRQHGEGTLKSGQISRIGRLVCNLADETFQVIDRCQVFPDLFSCDRIVFKFLYRIQSLINLFFM